MTNDERRAYQREYIQRRAKRDPAWHERRKQRHRDWSKKRFAGSAEALEVKAAINEKSWRFSMWEAAHIDPELKSLLEESAAVVSQDNLENPIFIVEYNGARRFEKLNEALPTWFSGA